MTTPFRRVFVLQNGLKSRSSHYFHESQGWKAVLARLGRELVLHAHADCEEAVARGLDARRTFHLEPDCPLPGSAGCMRLQTLIEGSSMFAADCQRLDADGAGPGDLVVIPYATDVELLGLAVWADQRTSRGQALPFLVGIVHRPDFDWAWNADKQTLSGDVSFMTYACRRFGQAAGPSGHLLLTTTSQLARALKAMIGVEIAAGCASNYYGAIGAGTPAAGSGRYDFALLGQMRPEKGSRIVAAIVQDYLARRPQARIAIQLHHPSSAARMVDDYDAIAGETRIDWLLGDIDTASYAATMARSNCILIPFQPDRYAMRASGIFSDALAMACPVVVPSGTWMEAMLADGYGSGLIAQLWSAPVFARAVERVNLDINKYRAAARASVDAWRRDQSLDRLIDIMLREAAATVAAKDA